MKYILLPVTFLFCFTIMGFNTQKEKTEPKIKYEFTPAEVQLIYNALGELPAKQSEGLRAKIAAEYVRQTDTTSIKKKP